jgi:hypothetical protein
MPQFYVYIYWNPLSGHPFYVGKGSGKRAKSHLYNLKEHGHNLHKHYTIQKIQRHGLQPLLTFLWRGNDEYYAFRVEKFLIALWGRKVDGGILTNLTLGGEGSAGFKHTAETRKKISDGNRGRHQPSSTIAKISQSKLGHTHSAEAREKIGNAAHGRHVSEETKSKMSRAVRKHWKVRFQNGQRGGSPKNYVITEPNGSEHQIRNLTLFCQSLGVSVYSFKDVLRTGKRISRGRLAGWAIRHES